VIERLLGVIGNLIEDRGELARLSGFAAGLRGLECKPGEVGLAEMIGTSGIPAGLVEKLGCQSVPRWRGTGSTVGCLRPRGVRGDSASETEFGFRYGGHGSSRPRPLGRCVEA
jgi:hypothetical protein